MDKESRREYMRRYQREWVAKRRAAFFSDKQCAQCGGTERLELDHINPDEKVTHNIWSWSEARRLAEIAKCQVLCHDCHAFKTYKEDFPKLFGYDPEAHGKARYNKGCRCDVCRAANSACFRAWKQKKAA